VTQESYIEFIVKQLEYQKYIQISVAMLHFIKVKKNKIKQID